MSVALRRDRAPDIRYYVGSTGSGKTFRAARDLARHRGPALVWDWKDDHPDEETATSCAHLAVLVRAQIASGQPRVLRYVPRYANVDAQFDFFCRLAWARQRARPRDDLLFLVEELPEVTQAARAPEVWRRIINQGRVLGFSVIATTQRPALVDKSFTGAATLIAAGRLGELTDAKVIGQRINVAPELLQQLPDHAAFVYDGRRVKREGPGAKKSRSPT